MADTNENSPNFISEDDFKAAVFEDGGGLLIDLSNVEESKFENVPKGIYDAEIDNCEFGKSKSSGAPMFTLVCSIQGGDYNGRKLYTYVSFSQKAIRGSKATLMRIDPTLFSGQFNPQKIADDGTLLGKPIRIKVGIEEYNGEDRSRITQILPASGGAASSGGGSNGGFFSDADAK